jgi:maltooligosyltrehalose trehalohydrolase
MVRELPVGAEVGEDGVSFRVWAPDHEHVAVVLEGRAGGDREVPCAHELDGYHAAFVRGAKDGDLYRYRLGRLGTFPDPASRFQPDGPHGPSAVVDPHRFAWSDAGWRGVAREGQVVYELHVGTFTREGTWAAAVAQLPRLAELGITLVEMMPVADFPGRFGWGYDGVDLFAPTRLYGRPDDLRAFVDAAHAHGLGVVLDVVYNHFGPDGCYLRSFAEAYFTKRHDNEWGDALDYDGPSSRGLRDLVASNAAYWIREFHMDGLRLDATHAMHDASRGGSHVLAEIVRSARAAAPDRRVWIAAENESEDVRLVREHGVDAMWNDDLHHSAIAALTGKRKGYYVDHMGTPQELVSAARWGFLFQGQRYAWQKKRRGTRAFSLPATSLVAYLENHDQVANGASGARLVDRASPGRVRAMTAYLLLGPETPLLFQGQELGVRTPFVFFADHRGELARAVKEGRARFLAQFVPLASDAGQAHLDDPTDPGTFEKCKIEPRHADARVVALFADLLRLRRDDVAFSQQRADCLAGAVIGPDAFVLRFFAETGDRLLVVNLGVDLDLAHVPEPLLGPPRDGASPLAGARSTPDDGWRVVWSSEDPRYGGDGLAPLERDDGWHLPGHAAVVLG